MHPLETYLAEIGTLRGATKETSGYPALANLLNAVGQTLKPKVKCLIHPKNSGAGIPDGGLFLPEQLKNRSDEESFLDQKPARGVIEVKSTADEIDALAQTPQVEKYLAHYGLILLTNYRSFLLLKRGDNGKPIHLESFQLASDEKSFWMVASQPRKAATELGERFLEYLKRVMLHNAPLNNPKDVAFFLASYARDARARVETAGDLPALNAVRSALEEALGMKFEAEKGEHFFRSTLVQTLFYGVFSAWVLWHKEKPQRKNDFDWKMAAWTLHVPMIKALFDQVATPTKLGPLGLVEVLDWTANALNRVERPAFFEKFLESHAVQYFYEPFLEAFDPELRKQLGVWYTPPEIVQYQVARVDAALREELDIPDGLADPRVFVLDPCCGTGAYLVEVLRKISETLLAGGEGDALNAEAVKKAAQERVFGFELLPAPFVVAHLQMGLLLQNLGVPLDDVKERAAIYLTNALTGWEPPSEAAKKQLTFAIPEFKQEKAAADGIKQEKKIIVILGNPPYNGYAGLAVEEERDLSNAYRTTRRAAAPQGQGLNDLYIRFFRMAERRIVEKSGEGIISFISNYSWLDGLSFTGMREKYLEVFDSITVDCLNGDKFKTGKLTPAGEPDPSVFSTESNREGIQVGTAIATLVRSNRPAPSPHPNPLPAGEGTATKARSKTKRVGSIPAQGAVLPLPTGEGRGEGNAVVQTAAALARNSTHPISQALAKLSSDAVAVSDWKEIRGSGVEAKLRNAFALSSLKGGEGRGEEADNSEITIPSPQLSPRLGGEREQILRLGSLNWLRENGVDLVTGEKFVAEWSGQGATIVGLSSAASLLGLFAVRDAVKTNAAQVIAQLQQQGFKTFLLTGDNALTAASIAKQVRIAAENIFAEVRPEQKAEFVKRLQTLGERVAFVGDGINDAPALTQADLGVAVSRASDVAREAADIILLKSEIEAVPEALGLARATLRTIKQNLFWAFFYNALGVPLAACGVISPIFCAAAMGFSDLIVIGNALRLLRWQR